MKFWQDLYLNMTLLVYQLNSHCSLIAGGGDAAFPSICFPALTSFWKRDLKSFITLYIVNKVGIEVDKSSQWSVHISRYCIAPQNVTC